MSEQKPHTVPAGVLDVFLGNRGPHGELMHNGEPVMTTDVPADDDEDEDDEKSPD